MEQADDARIQRLDDGIREARRNGADFVVVRGPAEVTIPLADDCAAQNRDPWDTRLRVDLYTYAYRRSLVALWPVTADLLSAVNPWRYRPRTTRMRVAWYRKMVQQQKILLRLHNAHHAPAVHRFIGAAPGRLIVVTARTRLWLVTEKMIWVDLRSAHHIERRPAAWSSYPDREQWP